LNEGRSLVLSASNSGQRLDQYLAQRIDTVSRPRARELILAGNVHVDGRGVRPSYRVQTGDRISVELPAPVPSELIPEDLPLSVLYEDEDMIVLDKPPGIAVHPAPGHAVHTLVHALLFRYPNLPGIGGTQRPGIVHRLDMDTSGLLMVAKSERGLASLSTQLEGRAVKKGYLALLVGRLATGQGIIDAPIARDPRYRQRMAIVDGGRHARTLYRVLTGFERYTLALAMPETGRTHQIRVHFAALGAPVAGDALYGGGDEALGRQFLHAAFLRFARPSDAKTVELQSALPPDLREVLEVVLRTDGKLGEEVDRSIGQMLRLSEKHFRNELLSSDVAASESAGGGVLEPRS
jgi:23S rRNA pseudouridine1911/1915/1917 synthase